MPYPSPGGGVSSGAPLNFVDITPATGFSTTATQNPAGQGVPLRIVIGSGGSTTGGEFTLAPNGVLTCNLNNVQYEFDLVIRIGRTGGGGVSEVLGRLMYAEDGIEGNAVQVGSSFGVEIDDGDTIWREAFNLKFSPTVGSILWFEIARDEAGSNSGGLLANQPTGALSSWNEVNTAELSILKGIVQ